VCPNTYKEGEIRFLKWMLTPIHKEIKSNKLETTNAHSSGGELKMTMTALIK
jgi:hypothetical protein